MKHPLWIHSSSDGFDRAKPVDNDLQSYCSETK
uniref:Uncharacterized protein n=1 Tax=Anguilla anguilla TaxID=7936 RepID=A0A0E9U1J9_ANGAN